MTVKLLIGLGNPGRKYSRHRHNIGFTILDRLADEYNMELDKKKFKALYAYETLFGNKCCLIKPQTYMNLSGETVSSFLNYYKAGPEEMLVVHDDIDLPLGKIRISKGSGHGGNNGVRSIIEHLKVKDFYRLRVGVGRPPEPVDPASYVLMPFADEEFDVVESVIKRSLEAIEVFYKQDPLSAMQIFN